MFINHYIFKCPQGRNKPQIVLRLVAAAYIDSEEELVDVTAYILALLQQLRRDPLPPARSTES
jgi:hypothetical protein